MSKNSIPKIIHYCWFGNSEKPKIVKKCINSWKDKLKDYEIIEWNEKNFDVNSNEFTKKAYEDKKFAFVSDYVRIYVLYKFGGIYMDTDVEVIKEFTEEILNNESFWGFEEKNFIATSTIGAKKNNKFIGEFLKEYEKIQFNKQDMITNVAMVSKMVQANGVSLNGKYQRIEGAATFYPQEYFSPYDYINCYSKSTENTYTIHHYYKSWLPFNQRVKSKLKLILSRVIGGENIKTIREKLIRS